MYIYIYKYIHIYKPPPLPTRWSTTLPSKVIVSHAINFRALSGANLVTSRSRFRGNETLVVHCAVRGFRGPQTRTPVPHGRIRRFCFPVNLEVTSPNLHHMKSLS